MNIIHIPEILLPKKNIELFKWAVVACDQFTSQKDYWQELEGLTEGALSTLNLIYPEVYLEQDTNKRIDNINKAMRKCLDEDIFDKINNSFILVERDTPYTKNRLGLVMAVDLDAYDFTPFSDAYIKATEGTIIDRIPPRVEIRKNAPLELPHIMLLIDDRKNSVIEPLYENRENLELLYDTDLNMKGGHIKGYKVTNTADIIEKIYKLLDKKIQLDKYNKVTNFLFAVGDGNHSLATAKAHWDNIKKGLTDDEKNEHPARYALVEVNNLHDKSLVFEPIHRVVFNDGEAFIDAMKNALTGEGKVELIYRTEKYVVNVSENNIEAIKQIQNFIDDYILNNPDVVVDYIHGMADLKQVCEINDGIGIAMPTIVKDELFDFIIHKGVLPRKAFSMGEAVEKRYYLEAKKIVKY